MADSLPSPLTEAQLEIMNIVWDRGETTLGEIWKSLSERRKVAGTTVQTLLTRLVEKGWLRYRAEGKVFHYSAAHPRQPILRQMVRRMADSAFGGSTQGMVMALLEDQALTKEEADRLRELIDRAERGKE